ncbi:hypothetical protein MHYP_G00058410 [Metynnis hypsauchen]
MEMTEKIYAYSKIIDDSGVDENPNEEIYEIEDNFKTHRTKSSMRPENLAVMDDRLKIDFPDHKSWLAAVSEMELASSTDPGYFRIGDRVRVKASVSAPKYKWGEASHRSVAVDGENMTVDFPEHKSWKAAVSEMELAPSADSAISSETMTVDFPEHKSWKAAVSEMELAPSEDSAISGESMTVDFPEHRSWKAAVSEMELAPSEDSETFRVGDRVRVKATVSSPKYDWGKASNRSVALAGESMTVDFPEHKSWKAAVSEMELAPSADPRNFRIGDEVRVKASVSAPTFDWGYASNKSVGVVTAIRGESITVDFPEHKSWKAAVSEMELAPSFDSAINGERMTVSFPEHKVWTAAVSEMELAPSADSANFRVGDRVRVKASVTTPKYKWGSASHSSVGVVTAVTGDILTVDFPEHKSWKAADSEMELAPSDNSQNFRIGDRVRVKASVSSPKYGWGSASHSSVGVVTAIRDQSMNVDFPDHKSWMAAISEMELAPSVDSETFRVGDRVRVKASVSSPKYDWGRASHRSVALDGERMTVDFPEHTSWKAAVSEMELAPSVDSETFRVGDRVRVKTSVSSPKYGWGDASRRSVGVVTGKNIYSHLYSWKTINGDSMTVDFPEHKSWKAAVSEMELAPSSDSETFRVGDRVRVKTSVSSPKYGWGDASRRSVGVVKAINGESMTVDFPEHKSWKAAVFEMELAPSSDSETFRIGDRVRVKASVSSPKYQWGKASNRSVGVVTALDGESLTVDFPEHKSWKAAVSEMELAPSADSRNFRIGDEVRVKASVSSPKYMWGSASNKSVGVVTAISGESMTVDFPEHKSWKAAVSEMELAPSFDSGNFRVGDRVRVKASVSSPKYGWGDASHRSVGVVTAINSERMTVDFPEHKSWTSAVFEMELAPSTDSGTFRVGDRVRVKASVSTPKYKWGSASHSSVGVVTGINGESMTVDFPEHKSWMATVSEMELAPSADLGNFRVGDQVRVKASVSSPKYGWGSASHRSVGVVTAINGDIMTVNYPEHRNWKAAVSEMELAPSADLGNFRVGDRVRVKASVSSPKYDWGRASHGSVGVVTAISGESMTVDFPEHKSWKAAVSEMELAPNADSGNFRIGDRVRVKASVSSPKYDWGRASHSSVGVVTAINGESLTVDFPEHKSWKAAVSEMELAPSTDTGNFRIGDRVRVKASVSTPKYKWGSASHSSVGVVTAINGESMMVDFPDHRSWKAEVSEMELAPSEDSENFRVGDRVRVKASVSSPKYDWGSASHRSVGVVTAVNGESLTVDFPEHKSWKAAASDMELAPSTDSMSLETSWTQSPTESLNTTSKI